MLNIQRKAARKSFSNNSGNGRNFLLSIPPRGPFVWKFHSPLDLQASEPKLADGGSFDIMALALLQERSNVSLESNLREKLWPFNPSFAVVPRVSRVWNLPCIPRVRCCHIIPTNLGLRLVCCFV